MSNEKFKHNLYSEFSRIGKALSSPGRIEILELLAQSSRTVDALAKLTGLSVANTSQHLQSLKQTGLVIANKSGQHVIYKLTSDDVIYLVQTVRKVAETHISGVENLVTQFISSQDEFEPLNSYELLHKLDEGSCIVIDVRPEEEYNAGHLAGSENVPLKSLFSQLRYLDKQKEIVAYCRGPYCLMSLNVVKTLREHGFHARRFADGFPEWKLAGLPVEFSLPEIGETPIDYAI